MQINALVYKELIDMNDPKLDWLPSRFSEKYRRYYVNHELVERRDLKKLERALIRAFRYAFVRYYTAKGYRLAKDVIEKPEVYGPTPGVIWLLFLSSNEVIAIVGDSSIPLPHDKYVDVFQHEFVSRLIERGYHVHYAKVLDMSHRYRWGDASRVIYLRIELIPSAE